MAKYGVAVYGVDKYGAPVVLTFTGKRVFDSLTETGKLVIGSLTETGVGVIGESASVEGGSDAIIVVSATGTGIKNAFGGSDASIILSTTSGGEKTASGGSDVDIDISATGSGIKQGIGSSSAIVVIAADGSGVKQAVGGSDAVIIIYTEGEGVPTFLYMAIIVNADRSIYVNKGLLEIQADEVFATVDVNDALWDSSYHLRLDALLPNGIIESKGVYDYSASPVIMVLGDGDNILSLDGTLKLQLSFIQYAADGTTEIVKRRSKILTKKIIKAT